ncbi:MAG: hypothetical protein HY791_36320 [Deltaproteobacteria bacterium]|nr:hypothetical protein [Deltaproteobacteria bacterium]
MAPAVLAQVDKLAMQGWSPTLIEARVRPALDVLNISVSARSIERHRDRHLKPKLAAPAAPTSSAAAADRLRAVLDRLVDRIGALEPRVVASDGSFDLKALSALASLVNAAKGLSEALRRTAESEQRVGELLRAHSLTLARRLSAGLARSPDRVPAAGDELGDVFISAVDGALSETCTAWGLRPVRCTR